MGFKRLEPGIRHVGLTEWAFRSRCYQSSGNFSETNCPFYLWSDGNKRRSAHASFSSSVPPANTRLAVAPYVRIRSLACMYKHAAGMQALFSACVWSTNIALIFVHTGVRTTAMSMYFLPMHGICHIPSSSSICMHVSDENNSMSSAGFDAACGQETLMIQTYMCTPYTIWRHTCT